MSVQPKQKTPKLDPHLVNQLLSGRKTAGEIEDLLKGVCLANGHFSTLRR